MLDAHSTSTMAAVESTTKALEAAQIFKTKELKGVSIFLLSYPFLLRAKIYSRYPSD
jgi:hypothetical protein